MTTTEEQIQHITARLNRAETNLRTAEEALGAIANEVAKRITIKASSYRSAKHAAELAGKVREALEASAALSPAPTPRAAPDALLTASVASLKSRIGKLEDALRAAGVDPITVHDDEPEGFRDPSHGAGGKVVEGAADDLRRAFEESFAVEPDDAA